MLLEVPIDNVNSANAAVYSLCDELEVCGSLQLGGLTPTIGLVTRVLAIVDNFMTHSEPWKIKRPKVNVMIRCRPGNDFCFNTQEVDVMMADVDHFKKMQINGFVFGCLDSDGDLDYELCTLFLARAKPIPVTFHRAFDFCRTHHILIASDLARLGFSRILTSGRQPSVSSPEAHVVIRDMIRSCGQDIEIMPGGGLTASYIPKFKELGCKIIHSSCKTVKKLPIRDNNFGLSNNSEMDVIYTTEGKLVRRMIMLMNVEKKRLLLDDTIRTSFDLKDGDDSD